MKNRLQEAKNAGCAGFSLSGSHARYYISEHIFYLSRCLSIFYAMQPCSQAQPPAIDTYKILYILHRYALFFAIQILTCRYDLDDFPSGASRTGSVCPNKMPFGEFRDNVAHTCNEFGLRIWETYQPYVSNNS